MMIFPHLSRREKYIFIIAVITVVSAITYKFIFEPVLKKMTDLDKELFVKTAALRKSRALLQNRNGIIEEYNSYAVSFESASGILSYIKKQADSSKIKTANMKPLPVSQKELYSEYTIELQIEGEAENIVKFISALNVPPVFITVKKFNLRAENNPDSYLKGILILGDVLL
jgi:Tfp pilus assembly protein PilO